MSQDKNNDQSQDQQKPPTPLIWAVRGGSLLIILAILGTLAYWGIQPTEKPCFVYEIKAEDCQQREGRWALPVKITNEGTTSAHDLTTRMVLENSGEKTAQQVTLPMIGSRESITLEFWYDEDPRGQRPSASVVSYVLP